MKKLIVLLLLVVASQVTAWAATYSVIVELQPSARITAVAAALGGKVIDSIPGTNYYLLQVSVLPTLQQNPMLGIQSIEVSSVVPLRPGPASIGILSTASSQVPDWYAKQPSMKLIRADAALAYSKGRGIVVADLNARVDYGHPALVGHLTTGFDFVAARASQNAFLNQSSAGFLDQSSAAFLDQSTASFLDQSTASFLDQSSAAFLDQSTASFLDQSTASFLDQSSASFLDQTNPAHGHGTFCAGLIAAVAPESMIMPLRVFDDQGNADSFMIARAIRYAAMNGAQVINMSFGMTSDSGAVKSAVAFAIKSGAVVVASAGNGNASAPQYPAAFANVVSVAATNLMDQKASFSNYGSSIYVTAPGVNVVSAYPGGYYAMASGTSFSAPLVAGEAALLRSMRWTGTRAAVAAGAINIDSKNPDYAGRLGYGRVDFVRALQSQN